MSTKASGLSAAFMIINAANMLCARGCEPQRALRIAQGVGDGDGELPSDIDAMARAIWAAIGSDGSGSGRVAALDRFSRILACAQSLCSFGVEPCEAINLLRWVDIPGDFESAARVAWASIVDSGAVVRVAWSFAMPFDGSGLDTPPVVDVLSRILGLADSLRTVGVEPHNVINVLGLIALPPRLATIVRATWAIAAGVDDEGSNACGYATGAALEPSPVVPSRSRGPLG